MHIETIKNNFWIFDISFVNIFSFFILKRKLYRFQYLSLSMIIILRVVLNVINLYNLKGKWLSLLTILSIEIMYSLKKVIHKYSMEYNYCLPNEIGFYEGFFVLIVNIILLKKYTPSHIVLILIIEEIAFAFSNNNNWKLYSTIIIFIILFFMLLVFTQIIELNFWGLQNDIKKNILKRVKLQEMLESSDNYSNYSIENDRKVSNISNLSYNNRDTERNRKYNLNDY